MGYRDSDFRKLDQLPPPREVRFPKQPQESIDAGEDYYEWCRREFGSKEEDE